MEETDIEQRLGALETQFSDLADKLSQLQDLLSAAAAMLTTLQRPTC